MQSRGLARLRFAPAALACCSLLLACASQVPSRAALEVPGASNTPGAARARAPGEAGTAAPNPLTERKAPDETEGTSVGAAAGRGATAASGAAAGDSGAAADETKASAASAGPSTGAPAMPRPQDVAGAARAAATDGAVAADEAEERGLVEPQDPHRESLDTEKGSDAANRIDLEKREGRALERARRALEEKDYAQARRALDDLLAMPSLARVREHLVAGEIERAMEAAREALVEAPGHATAQILFGECAAALGLRDSDSALLDEALSTLRPLAGSPRVDLARSRVARALGLRSEALEAARAAVRAPREARASDVDDPSALPAQAPGRTLALAARDAWRAAEASDASARDALLLEIREALATELARQPGDVSNWRLLSDCLLEARRPADARAALERALERIPSDRGLLEDYARALEAQGGLAEVLRGFERWQGRRPRLGLYWFVPAQAVFREALSRRPGSTERFTASENGFRIAREKDRALWNECARYEALTRVGRGWCALDAGDLEGARRAFDSAENFLRGGLEVDVPDRLPSGRQGLQLLLSELLERQRVTEAAELALRLFRYDPGDRDYARQAGALQRELGEGFLLLARDYKLAAERRLTSPERLSELRTDRGIPPSLFGTGREFDEFRETAGKREQSAEAAFAKSFEALRALVELDPDDLRARCDAADVAVKCLHAHADWAEAALRAGIERGEALLATELDDEREFEVRLAVGDACQTLGILHLELRRDPRAARTWFERSLATGGIPRPAITETYLPACERTGP